MKTRLDLLLVEQGLVSGRERAKSMIMAGQVYVNGQKCDKAGTAVDPNEPIEVRGDTLKYVSRGGLKLEKAVTVFGLRLEGAVCVDIGASTGGFTDCMLRSGAVRVYAVDVGYGQLAWTLRTDPRVVSLERTNIRYVNETQIPESADFISIDVSFISLKLVLPVAAALLKDGGGAVCLVKPQFEAGREKVGKKGVVRDQAVHKEVVLACMGYAVNNGFRVAALDYSPIKGPEGNIEYLLYLVKDTLESGLSDGAVERVVQASHTGGDL